MTATIDRYSNAEMADTLACTKRDLLKMSESMARFLRVVGDECYPTGQRMAERTLADLNALAVTLDERIETLNTREGR